jgi:hypothetical protein
MKGITGIENEVLYKEIRKAAEERYPLSDGKIYIPVVVVYEHIRENKERFPNLNLTSDKHMKRIITQTFTNEFGWRRYGSTHTMSVRSAVFNRSAITGDESV